jgi:hypothetical protein
MKLVVEFSISNSKQEHEHRSWVVDGDITLQQACKSAAAESHLEGNRYARIINTRIADEEDVHFTKKLELHV